ncbi:MAG TPA: nitroreductase family deazaflavin-dependent oxidoreductase [Candidatus Acidoferrum sp.]|jgi:deazaflavin-dependent oxidoreductase (nitroreductase family)|nr:nitroreductase family deazaflavin-dependent oxidoreductase [Candidatus Angelobacter sp.]HXD81098.1 nitroreductase family deazaflavin-dependent oxidoreductase [Candidatus Acidoferrum sp.]
MKTLTESKSRVPSFVDMFNPLARWMLGAGLPLGPNALITIRGRKSGEPRTTPIALIEIEGRRWVSSPFGDVNWVRNLRAAGEATLAIGRKQQSVTAIELSKEERVAFFRDLMGPYVRRIPLGLGRLIVGSILGAKEMLDDPEDAAERHPVFELR